MANVVNGLSRQITCQGHFLMWEVFMKKKLFVLLCAGMMMTGCADQKAGEQEKPEVISFDLGGDVQTDEANGEQADNLYMQFLNNEIPVVIGKDYPQDDYTISNLESGKTYTFAELGQYVNQFYFDPEYSEKTSYDYTLYTYVDCPDSDARNFLIKFVGLNIYSPDDDSFAVYVITEDHGQLYLTGEYECWARSYTEQYRNGLCVSGGSNGAGDHSSGISAILSDGKITDIYEAETLSGWWTSYVGETIYNEVFDGNTEIPLNVSIYTIGEEKYYTYDFSECTDDQAAVCEIYINRCRDEAGIDWVTDEEVEEAVKRRCSAIGVDFDTIDQQVEAEWTNTEKTMEMGSTIEK